MKDCPYIHFNSLVSPDSGNDSNASSNKIANNDKKAKNGKNGKEEEKKEKKEKEEKGAGNSQTEGNEKNGEIKNSDNNRIIIPAVTARVWRRNCVAELLGLTETQFVDLCILMGNDFTGNFPKDLYDRILESHEIPVKYGTIKFKETLQQVLQRNGSINSDADGSDSWVLKSSLSPAVELSIQYSRAFYQLEDITVFLTEENQKIVDNFYKNLRVGATETVDVVVSRKLLEEEAEYENMKLSEDQKELVVDWIKRNGKVIKDSKEKKSHNVNAGKLAVLFLQDLRKEKKKRVSNKLATKSNVDFQEVTTHQIDGLHQMLQFLKVRRGKVPSKDKVTITWTNVYLCNLYQIIAREIIRNLPKYAKGEVLPVSS